jgi:ribonuclease P protein component
MLPQNKKLHLNKDFDKIFKTGRSLYGRFLGVKIIKNNLDVSRFGVILGLKISKSSVIRHQSKRLIFRIISDLESKLPFFIDCVIIALPSIKEASTSELESEIKEIFSKISNKL